MTARTSRFTGALLLCLLAVAFQPAHADGPLALDQWRAQVARALALVRLVEAEPGQRTSLLNQAADLIKGPFQLVLPSGATLQLEYTDLAQLIADPTRTHQALERLAALETALASTPVTVQEPDLSKLQSILDHPPFVPDPSLAWLRELLRRLAAFLDELTGRTIGGVFDAGDFIILGAVLLVVVVLAYFIRQLRKSFVPENALPGGTGGSSPRSASDALANAQKLAGGGDYRAAIRELYLGLLLWFDEHGQARYDPALTNREHLRQSSLDPHLAAELRPLVDTFDRAWYGFVPVTAGEFEEFQSHVNRLMRERAA